MFELSFRRTLLLALVLAIASLMGCSSRPPAVLKGDLLGIRVGMPKADAQKRLEEIAVLETELKKRQQIWNLKDDPHFLSLAVGYNAEDRIRYITGFVEKDKAKAKKRIRFTEVGDISKAKQEISEPHFRYIWEVPASDAAPAHQVVLYGDQKDFVSFYTLVEFGQPAKELDQPSEEVDK